MKTKKKVAQKALNRTKEQNSYFYDQDGEIIGSGNITPADHDSKNVELEESGKRASRSSATEAKRRINHIMQYTNRTPIGFNRYQRREQVEVMQDFFNLEKTKDMQVKESKLLIEELEKQVLEIKKTIDNLPYRKYIDNLIKAPKSPKLSDDNETVEQIVKKFKKEEEEEEVISNIGSDTESEGYFKEIFRNTKKRSIGPTL
jgi:hypothetical protein